MIISFLNQKGGSGKSSLARAVAVEFARNNWSVIVADLDKTQQTFFNWNGRRVEEGVEPALEVNLYGDPKSALKAADNTDLLIIDGKAFADAHVLQIAQASDLVVLPVGISVDDLEPTLKLGVELTNKGIERSRMLFVVSKVPDNGDREAMSTRNTIENWNFDVVRGWITFKPAFSKTMDKGRAFTETPFPSLRKKSDEIVQQIVDKAMQTQNQSTQEIA